MWLILASFPTENKRRTLFIMTSWLSRIRQTCILRRDPVVPFTTLIQYWLILPPARLCKIPYFRANLAFVLLWFSHKSTISSPLMLQDYFSFAVTQIEPFLSKDAAAKRQHQLSVSAGEQLCGCAATPCWGYSKSCHLPLPTAASQIVQQVALLLYACRTDN